MLDKKIMSLLGKNKKYVRLVVLNQFITLGLTLLMTLCICLILKNLIANIVLDYKNFIFLCLIVFCELFKLLLLRLSEKCKIRLSKLVKEDLRIKIVDKAFTLDNHINEKYSLSSLVQMTLEGIEQLDLYYTIFLPQFFYGMIAPLALFIVVLTINPFIAFILLLCIPVIPMAIIMVSKFAKRVFNKYWNDYLAMGDVFLDNLNGLKELKIYNVEDLYHNKMKKKAEEFKRITMKVLVMQLWSITIMDLVAFGGAALGIVLAIINVKNNPNNIIISLFITLIAIEFFIPMRSLGSAFHISMNGRTAGNKILDFLNLETRAWGEKQVQQINQITFSNLRFSYDKFILQKINLEFKRNSITSIVGKSGSGKSTIAKLLVGSNKPQNGQILINSIDLFTLKKDKYYQKVTLVKSNTHIFNKSIKENFLIYNPNITEDKMKILLKQMQVYDIINIYGGLDFILNEEASNISGGEKQRIILACALAKDSELYIFDEATANIDFDSEQIIIENIYKLAKTKIVVLISHRLENTRNSDNIYVLEQGSVVQEGTFLDLRNKPGQYKELFDTQTDLENNYKKEK